MLFTVPFDDFGGLDLSDAVNESSGAIDLLNVDFDRPGRVRSRDGYATFWTGSGATPAGAIALLGSSLVVQAGFAAYAVSSAGATTATSATLAGSSGSLANFSSPTGTVVYGPQGTLNTNLFKWDGASFSYPATSYSGLFAAVTPWDNRLVLAYTTEGGTVHRNRVRFSDAGAPETYTANSYIDLAQGSGEQIMGVVSWNNQLFVFKDNEFCVFYGTSTDSTGQPIFNYRTVSGRGINRENLAGQMGCVAARDGVYFWSADGIYRTTGGTPAKVSTAIDPLFMQTTAPPNFASAMPTGGGTLGHWQDRILVGFFVTGGMRTLVYNTTNGAWSYWDIPAYSLFEFPDPSNTGPTTLLFSNNVNGHLCRLSPAATTDAGTAITSRYRSPFIPLDWRGRNLRSGIHGVDKTVRESMVEGTGTVSYALSNQWATTLPASVALTLGTSPAVAEARDRRSVRGRMFSFQLSGTSPWEVQTVSWNIYAYQAAGEQSEPT